MEHPIIDIEKISQEAESFDFVRLTICDINGIARGKVVPGRKVAKSLKNGSSFWTGAIGMGPRGELGHEYTSEDRDMQSGGNVSLKSMSTSISSLPWAAEGQFKVGELLCEPQWSDGGYQLASPRYVARKQLHELKSMGYKIYSSYEAEVYVLHKDSKQPITDTFQMITTLPFSYNERLFFEIEKSLVAYGVDLEAMETEFGHGQFEFTFEPTYDIDAPDMAFKFKTAFKEMCHQKGYSATFMTKPFGDQFANGLHFNHSLWDVDGKKSVFYNSEKEDNLSDTGRYFIGGVLEHAKALTALCCPTSNCYRRLNKPGVTPSKIDWGIDNRFVLLRFKNDTENGTYIENRLPSGSCNPYIAQAATLAAGIDGIKKKIEPPPKRLPKNENIDQFEDLPKMLSEAIAALEQDDVLTAALGKEFINWFVIAKKTFDLKQFEKHNFLTNNPSEVEAEREEFYRFM